MITIWYWWYYKWHSWLNIWRSEDRRSVVAVDAATVNARLFIHKKGEVEEFLDEFMIEQGLVDLESTEIDTLQSFYKM